MRPMPAPELAVYPEDKLPPELREQLREMLRAAYDEEIDGYLGSLADPIHVVALVERHLVSHALWITRWLAPGDIAPLETAYVELVGTWPHLQGRGYASAVMRRLAQEISRYPLGGLSPSRPDFYTRLGWELWRGPLFIRTQNGPVPEPDTVMILRTAHTPPLDLDWPLSAEWRPGSELW